jgi:ABC-type lipopolysaccharide export system ATPase subunit
VFKKLTVEENIRIVLEPLGLPRNEINNRIGELMAELKLDYLAGNKGPCPFRRRTAKGRNHAGPGHQAAIHPS